MKNGKGLLIAIAIAIAFTASLGYSQASGSATAGSTANAGSVSNAPTNNANSVTIDMQGSTMPQSHQLVQPSPGPTSVVFPGNAPGLPGCQPYSSKVGNLKFLSQAATNALAKGVKLPHGVKATLIAPEAATAENYQGPIGVMEYKPGSDPANSKDVVLNGIKIPGKPFEIDEAVLGKAVQELRKQAPAMKRVYAISCPVSAEVTDTTSKGIGAAGSGTNGTGQVGGGLSVGWFHGDSSTETEQHIVVTVYGLNGPFDQIAPLPPPEKEKGGTEGATRQPEAPAKPPLPPPAAKEAPAPRAQELPPPPPAITPPPVAATTAPEQDQLPQVNVYFSFDHPKVAEGLVVEPTVMTKDGLKDNAAAILRIQQWLESHPSVKIDVIGYACYRGPDKYNWDLGGRRAKAVFEAIIADEKIKGQVIEPDSNGKDSAASTGTIEYNWQDRRVSFRIHGNDSSGR